MVSRRCTEQSVINNVVGFIGLEEKSPEMLIDEIVSPVVSQSATTNLPPGTFISEWNFCGCVIGFDGTRAERYDVPRVYVINLLVLTALGWSLASRRKASIGLAGLILIPAIAALSLIHI